MLRSILALTLVPLTLLTPRDAEACSCLAPQGQFLSDADALLPSDAQGVVWAKGYTPNGAPEMRVTRLDGKREVVVEHTLRELGELVLVAPAAPLKPGQRFRFEALVGDAPSRRARPDLLTRVEVTVGSIALGPLLKEAKLVVTPTGRAPIGLAAGASCRDTFDAAQATVALELPEAAQPYLHALLFTTTVDGQPWHPRASLCSFVPQGRSWRELGQDVVFAKCGGRNAATAQLDEGTRAVVIQAALPGTALTTSVKSATVTLSCR